MQEEVNLREELKTIARILSKHPLIIELSEEEQGFLNELLQADDGRSPGSGAEEITLEEQRVLDEYMAKNGNKEIIEAILDSERRIRNVAKALQFKEQKEGSRQKYLDKIPVDTIAKIGLLKDWKTYVAAACVISIIAFSVLWIIRRNDHKLVTTEQGPAVVHDAQPGKFKAKLTLDDGTVVVLDSAKNGQLAQQGGTHIINTNGQLVYQGQGKENKVLYNTLSTSRGETYVTVLSDGSKVWLNSQSSIRYPVSFSGSDRTVQITGEAYFEVSKDPGHPFIVAGSSPSIGVPDWNVTVLGTHFNVNAYDNEDAIKTTLLEGKVRITKEGSMMLLAPGEQAVLRQTQDNKITLSKTKDIDVEAEVAWRFGYFQFNNADLKTVMRQLERWYDVEIVYQGDIPQRSFGGKISRSNSLSQVLETLQTNDVHFNSEGKKIIVSP